MKIVQFIGGLGNQMFQYAFYEALKKTHSDIRADLSHCALDKSHNGYELESVFNTKVNTASSLITNIYNIENKEWIYRNMRRIFGIEGRFTHEQKHFTYDPIVFSKIGSEYLSGFWQNELYFSHISGEIRKAFKFKSLLDQRNRDILEKINHTNSVSVHVRRGDYVDHPSFGGICELNYYREALEVMQSKLEAARFFIFSNDIDWCMNNLNLDNCEFISWNKNASSYIDMQLMSCCKHNIIANSTFSWWGAWLNDNPNKVVIGPKKWLQEEEYDTSTLLPPKWIRL